METDKSQQAVMPQMAELTINIKRVEDLVSEITRLQITVDRFRFDLSPVEALNLLAAQYTVAVNKRKGKLVLDRNTVSNLKALAMYITQPVPKFGVMMCGTCGNGKTTLLYALQGAINYLNSRNHFTFLSEYFKVGMQIMDAKEVVAISKNLNELKKVRSRSMLAIDDLGKEPAEVMDFGNLTSPVIDLLEYRYQHQLFTCITTNLTSSEISKKYGSRIADRFNEMLDIIVFQDISYRH